MNKSSLKLRGIVVSDVHMDIKNERLPEIIKIFTNSLHYSKNINSDFYITVGDTTSRGERINWNYARDCFKNVPDSASNIILTVGNHDCWSDGEDEYKSGIGEYYSACKDIMGRSLNRPYFSTVIDGYSFICLGNESDMGCDADISDEQIEWLEKELAAATQDSKPAFVFCHQSLNGRHGLPRTWDRVEAERSPDEGGVGEKSEKIAAVLKSFKNVFYFSGHSHMGLCGEEMKQKEGYASFDTEEGLHLINLPTLTCHNHHGEIDEPGIGLLLEIYEDAVKILPFDFSKQSFVSNVKIKDSMPYYQAYIM